MNLSLLEWITSGEKLLGLVLTGAAVIGAVASWFWRSVSRRVKTGVSDVETGQNAIMARLNDVEREVEDVKTDLDDVKARVGEIERGMSSLATSKELAALDRNMAGLSAEVRAQGTTLRMIYEAAMRADTSGRKS